MSDEELAVLGRRSRQAATISAAGAAIIILSLLYSAWRLAKVEQEVTEKRTTIALLDTQLRQQKSVVAELETKVSALRSTQDGILGFLANVADDSQVRLLDDDVQWSKVRAGIDSTRPGHRKQALLTAILLAWKDIPFAMSTSSIRQGIDSPRFIQYVLNKNGVAIDVRPGERASDALMRTFHKVDKPLPGDLVFYKGQVGSFGFIYLADGPEGSQGIGVGTLQASAPLQIISLDNINTPHYPLIGYYRVNYPGE